MDDLISRKAAITAIQNAYCDTEGGEDKYAVWKNNGLAEAFHIMQDLPAAQRWIPVTERMPDAYYLVWATDGKDVGIASFQRKGNFWLGDDNFSDYQPEVTHWMPLPEPPKEEP